MGGCSSTKETVELTPEEERRRREARIRNKWIEELTRTDKEKDRGWLKLLFLGTGESGKSTFLKQLRILHGGGFSDEDRMTHVPLLHSNILQAMKVLIKQTYEIARQEPDLGEILSITEHDVLRAAIHIGNELRYDDVLTPTIAREVDLLWHDPAIQACYAMRSRYQLYDSAQYFFERVHQCARPDFIPTDEDILRARIRTTGIVEHRFRIKDNDFCVIDVGGQRNARKKWIHAFERVTSVIFVAALSEYDQVLYEDASTNRMHEALDLFEDICESRYFRKASMILFLNKKDIFQEKIRRVSLNVCFPYYDGQRYDLRAALKFIKNEFKMRNAQADRRIYTHFTCATDTNNVRRVFDDVHSTILNAHLVELGLLDANKAAQEVLRGGYESDKAADEESKDWVPPVHVAKGSSPTASPSSSRARLPGAERRGSNRS